MPTAFPRMTRPGGTGNSFAATRHCVPGFYEWSRWDRNRSAGNLAESIGASHGPNSTDPLAHHQATPLRSNSDPAPPTAPSERPPEPRTPAAPDGNPSAIGRASASSLTTALAGSVVDRLIGENARLDRTIPSQSGGSCISHPSSTRAAAKRGRLCKRSKTSRSPRICFESGSAFLHQRYRPSGSSVHPPGKQPMAALKGNSRSAEYRSLSQASANSGSEHYPHAPATNPSIPT